MTTPKWEAIEYKGQPARRYPDGSIRNDKGHLMARHPLAYSSARKAIDKKAKANGQDVSNLSLGKAMNVIKKDIQTERKRVYREAAAYATLREVAAGSPNEIQTPPEAWGEIVAGQAGKAMGDFDTNAAKFVGKALDAMPEAAGKSRPVTNIDKQQVNIQFDSSTAEVWTDIASRAIEGEVREVSSSEPTDEDGEEEQGSSGSGAEAEAAEE